MEKNNEKRVLRVELDNDVKKVSITGKNGEEKVVMRQELDEDELEQATGGTGSNCGGYSIYKGGGTGSNGLGFTIVGLDDQFKRP